MAKWYKDSLYQSDIVLSTRVRLARNLASIPFPPKMSPEDGKRVIELAENALRATNLGFQKTDIQEASSNQLQRLVEQRFISPNLASKKRPSALFISSDESLSVMVNEEDHIRMQAIFSGFECDKAYELISHADSVLAQNLGYAVHPKYGYLTSCLTNVGTGMRVSCMMHLPAICKANIAENLFSALGKLGITVRGMYGEGSKAAGYLFQISNQTTLGISEEEIKNRFNDVINQLISKERELRKSLHNREGAVLEDKIMRSLGILRSARLMSSKEMLGLFSNVRWGISLGLIGDIDPSVLSALMVETSPAHLSAEGEDSENRDIRRAQIVRNMLKGDM